MAAVNVVRHPDGALSAVCEFCGATTGPIRPAPGRDRLSIWDIPPGWTSAPYPPDFVHADGSVGTQWSCPRCQARLDRGESLYSRGEAP